LILDTSAYSALKKGVPQVVSAVNSAGQLFIPTIVVGELRYGFLKGTKNDENEAILQKFLASPDVEILDITLDTTIHYAELYAHAKQKAKVLSHNDLWIAALARQTKTELLSLDKDFETLRPLMVGGLNIVLSAEN
jgi:tRNA(fMet)-specific endonuclease VapC